MRAKGFQPALPSRGATAACHHLLNMSFISTRAPLAGSDCTWARRSSPISYFNPRSPRGERPDRDRPGRGSGRFQPALPSRGATIDPGETREWVLFQPALPSRGATALSVVVCQKDLFQPALPSRGATSESAQQGRKLSLFQPALPSRGAT